MMVNHGGRLSEIANEYQIAESQWLDLSTGIAPFSYPIPEIPKQYWQQLPQTNPPLLSAAANYYASEINQHLSTDEKLASNNILLSNGSQHLIKQLPNLWLTHNPKSRCAFLPREGYKEHVAAWRQANFTICFYDDELPAFSTLSSNCVLVVINPNNPTGKLFQRDILLAYQAELAKKSGLLVVDEAFMDVISPSQSLCLSVNHPQAKNTIILRSFGKFFGLAGIRIGFAITSPTWCRILQEFLGPWHVNGPAQYIAHQALTNSLWQQEQKKRLHESRQKLESTLKQLFITNENSNKNITILGSNLFLTVYFAAHINVERIYQQLCQQAIYVRLTDEKHALRFGLTTEEGLHKLTKAIKRVAV